MPLLKAKLQYSTLPIGESFCLVADDPAAGPDIERWATRRGRFSHSGSRPAQGRNQQSARRCDLIKVLRNWMDRYLSDEEAILFALLLIGFFALIIWLGQPLAPVFTAVILAFIMQGGVERLMGLGMGKLLSVMVVFLSTILAFVGFLVGVVPALFQQAENFLSELPNLILTVQVQLENLTQRYPQYFNPEQISQLINQAGQQISGLGQWVLSFSLESLPGLIGLLIYLVLVPILVFFFLKDADLILGSIGKMLPDRRPIMAQVWVEMKAQVSNYVRGKFLEILIVGIVSYLAFAFMDLRYAGLLALLVGLSVVVPYIGAAVVTIPVAAVAFVQWGWSSEVLLVARDLCADSSAGW